MILTLKQQVISPESAKRLKELGCRQESLFYWMKISGSLDKFMVVDKNGWIEGYFYGCVPAYENYSAYTCADLLQQLPFTIEGDKLRLIRGHSQVWHIWYGDPKATFMDMSLVEGLSKMLIYLIEQKLIEVEK